MLRLLTFFVAVGLIAWGLAWVADHPGDVIINWQERQVQVSIFAAFVGLALLIGGMIFLWSVLRQLIKSPTMISDAFRRRTQRRGLEALSTGIIAVGSGDRDLALRYATQARKALPNEPLTELLRAQTAQLTGDKATARRIYESMLAAPDTELLGLRGLYLEATKEGETEAANQFAARAMRTNPQLDWPVAALFDMQCKAENWTDALETLDKARKYNHVTKDVANRRRAVLLAALAADGESENMDEALDQALEAHKLAPDLVPAADVAGRILASKGNTSKAASVIAKTWKSSPHPDLAITYAFARPGDSPKDRLARVKDLVRDTHDVEGPIALAVAAIEAKEWDLARTTLKPLLDDKLTKKVCALMARVEGEQNGDKGRVREWLSRAVTASRDATWTDETGVVSDTWLPASPATGELDVFKWAVPAESSARDSASMLEEWVRPLAIADELTRENDIAATEAEMITINPEPEPEEDPVIEAEPVETSSRKPPFKGNGIDSGAPDDPGGPDTGADQSARRAHVPRGKT